MLTEDMTSDFSGAEYVGVFCILAFWLWGKHLNTTDALSRCVPEFDHAELVETTCVLSGFLPLTKC